LVGSAKCFGVGARSQPQNTSVACLLRLRHRIEPLGGFGYETYIGVFFDVKR
jgi:hypothetical protein